MTIQSILTNTSAMASRRYVEMNGERLSVYQEQLSTGKKVADPSKDPSSAAIGYLLDSTLQVLEQASTNANQAVSLVQLATGTLGSTQEILTRMSSLATQANSDSIGEAQRTLLNKEYQTLLTQINENSKVTWAGVKMFNGGASTASRLTSSQSINGSQTGTVFSTTLNTESRGLIGGAINNVSVQDISNGLLQVDMVVGDQTFKATTTGIKNTATGTLTPSTSQTLSFTGAGAGAAAYSAINLVISNSHATNTYNAASIAALLAGNITLNAGDTVTFTDNTSPGLSATLTNTGGGSLTFTAASTNGTNLVLTDTTTGGNTGTLTSIPTIANASVKGSIILTSSNDPNNQIVLDYNNTSNTTSYTTALTLQAQLKSYLNLNNGAPASLQSASTALAGATYTVGAAMDSGVWGVSYAYDSINLTGLLKLTNGKDTFTSKVESTDMSAVNGSFNFDNGFKVALAGFVGNSSKSMEIINISSAAQLIRSFQIGEGSSDMISMTFNTINTDTLNLNGTDITSMASATDVATKVAAAIKSINLEIANFGSKRSQLDAIGKNLELSIQNQSAAKATFTDTDIPHALMENQKHQALMNTASSMLQNTLQRYREMSDMIRSVTR